MWYQLVCCQNNVVVLDLSQEQYQQNLNSTTIAEILQASGILTSSGQTSTTTAAPPSVTTGTTHYKYIKLILYCTVFTRNAQNNFRSTVMRWEVCFVAPNPFPQKQWKVFLTPFLSCSLCCIVPWLPRSRHHAHTHCQVVSILLPIFYTLCLAA